MGEVAVIGVVGVPPSAGMNKRCRWCVGIGLG